MNNLRCSVALGSTQSADAKSEGLNLMSPYNWRYRLNNKGLIPDPSCSPTPRRTGKSRRVRLRWPNGWAMEFTSEMNPSDVKQLLELVGVKI